VSARTADILDLAADLIEPPGAWTQGAFARAADGASVVSTDPLAVCWCASGAISKVTGSISSEAVFVVREALRKHLPDFIARWNDDPARTQPEVVAMLREAAKAERAAEGGVR
jgi:hypothetical protein